MRKQRQLWGLVAVAVGFALLIGGVATASNMGFKFVPSIGANQAFNLSLPWNNNYTNAKSLLTDLPGVSRVARFNANSSLTNWTPTSDPSQNFSIVKGSSYVAFAGGSGSNTAVIVGSHDPNYTFSFTAGQAYNAAAPYHQTLTNAKGLLNDLNTKLGAGSVGRVSKFTAGSTLQNWTSTSDPSQNFNLDLGMGVIIFPSQTKSGYVWPHY